MMDILEFEQYAEAFEWALANKPLLKVHEPALLKFVELVEKKIEARLETLGTEAVTDEETKEPTIAVVGR